MENIKHKDISVLNVGSAVEKILIDNKITTLGKLSTKTKTELKDIQLNAREIKDIEIKLELKGLMLNGSL